MREIEGVHGVHVMAYRQEQTIARIIREARLLPRHPFRHKPHRDTEAETVAI